MDEIETLQDVLNEISAEEFTGQLTINFEKGYPLKLTKKSLIKLKKEIAKKDMH